MRIDLRGRRALVTGSTGGIGFATAKALLDAGADVVMNGRSPAGVEAALWRLAEQREAGASDDSRAAPTGFVGDLAELAAVERLVAEHPDLDIVVNNIGAYAPKDVFDLSDDDWDDIFQRNVMSGVRTARAYLPGMMQRGWGRMIFVSSESAINIPTDMIHYGFTKTAQLAISRGFAKRVAGTGVTVNAVLPGPTLTDGVRAMLAGDDELTDAEMDARAREFVAQERGSSLIQRMATVDEVASMIVYVASEQASATTGAALRVDGGVVESIL